MRRGRNLGRVLPWLGCVRYRDGEVTKVVVFEGRATAVGRSRRDGGVNALCTARHDGMVEIRLRACVLTDS